MGTENRRSRTITRHFGHEDTSVLLVAGVDRDGGNSKVFERDVALMSRVLTSKSVGIKRENLVTVFPDPVRGDTMRRLHAGIDRVAEKLSKSQNGHFIFYYSGHFTERSSFVLGKEMYYKDYNLATDLKRVPAKFMLIICDMCFSGSADFNVRSGVMHGSDSVDGPLRSSASRHVGGSVGEPPIPRLWEYLTMQPPEMAESVRKSEGDTVDGFGFNTRSSSRDSGPRRTRDIRERSGGPESGRREDFDERDGNMFGADSFDVIPRMDISDTRGTAVPPGPPIPRMWEYVTRETPDMSQPHHGSRERSRSDGPDGWNDMRDTRPFNDEYSSGRSVGHSGDSVFRSDERDLMRTTHRIRVPEKVVQWGSSLPTEKSWSYSSSVFTKSIHDILLTCKGKSIREMMRQELDDLDTYTTVPHLNIHVNKMVDDRLKPEQTPHVKPDLSDAGYQFYHDFPQFANIRAGGCCGCCPI